MSVTTTCLMHVYTDTQAPNSVGYLLHILGSRQSGKSTGVSVTILAEGGWEFSPLLGIGSQKQLRDQKILQENDIMLEMRLKAKEYKVNRSLTCKHFAS